MISVLNCKQFIINLNLYLKDDLPDALIYVRVFLASIKEMHLKPIADQILRNLWKLFKIIPYGYNVTFRKKAFDFINLPKILRLK